MQHGRHGEHFSSFPFRIGVARADPFSGFKLRVAANTRLLFPRTVYEKKPGVESSRSKRRRHPAADESKIPPVQTQRVMAQQLRPRHTFRFEIVEQRSALSSCQR